MPPYQGIVRRCTVCGEVKPTYAKLRCKRCYQRELYRYHTKDNEDKRRPQKAQARMVSTPEAFREMAASLTRFTQELGL